MDANTSNLAHTDRTRVIAVIGVLLLLSGIAVGFLGPLEMYCFYLYSEGGRFHYEGFGFGSFMFGNIASQIVGYYLIAALFIPLGYGHLTICVLHHHAPYTHLVQRHVSGIWRFSIRSRRSCFA